MRRNKKMEQIANQSMEHLKNDEFLSSLVGESPKVEKKKFNTQVFQKGIAAVCAALLILVALPIGIFFGTQGAKNPTDDIKYAGNDERTAVSTLEELNNALQGAILRVENPTTVTRRYDSVSNHDLYYVVNYSNDETFEAVTIVVITNPNYEYAFDNPQALVPLKKTADMNGLSMRYRETAEIDEGIYFIDSEGYIECTERIHITYTGISFEENTSNFLPQIRNMIKKK